MSGAVKRYFRWYIQQDTSLNEHFEYDYSHSNALALMCLFNIRIFVSAQIGALQDT